MIGDLRQERIVWPASTPGPKGRICSAFWRTLEMSTEIRQIVETTYTDHIGLPPEWRPEQRRVFLDQEASRLTRLVHLSAASLQERVISDWTKRMGREPDYLTTVGLINQAKAQAREIVLSQELYEQIPELIDPAVTETFDDDETPRVDWHNPNRWNTLYRSEPTTAVEQLVLRLWPTRSDWFRIKAEYLLQARLEDELPIPDTESHPLIPELVTLIEDAQRGDAMPLD